ncbi:hypothetical protein Y032_0225g2755 [Ancylostoma ceylanicum]|uniref:Uncharacterized protein n=1 Tax=Ancylostoma ceylanicum TaxID=53326 RepID=A0A016SGW5_9BILA|nr:hypothetical protein Y032_0225g2755 [Ancylostoma ceylanicum]
MTATQCATFLEDYSGSVPPPPHHGWAFLVLLTDTRLCVQLILFDSAFAVQPRGSDSAGIGHAAWVVKQLIHDQSDLFDQQWDQPRHVTQCQWPWSCCHGKHTVGMNRLDTFKCHSHLH